MRKHIFSSVLLLMVMLFAGSKVDAYEFKYTISNNSSNEIIVKLKKHNGDTKREHTLKAGGRVDGTYNFNSNSDIIFRVSVKVPLPGSHNDLGCSAQSSLSSYADKIMEVVYGSNNILEFKMCDAGSCGNPYSLNRAAASCQAVLLDPK